MNTRIAKKIRYSPIGLHSAAQIRKSEAVYSKHQRRKWLRYFRNLGFYKDIKIYNEKLARPESGAW